MNIEKQCSNPEQGESMEKRRLLELEREGKYLFHGSAMQLEKIAPRQPQTWSNENNRMEDDGPSSVAATPYAEIAIFRAIVNSVNVPGSQHSSFGASMKGKKISLSFGASKDTLERIKGKGGFVYVFGREGFIPKNGREENMDWRKGDEVEPLFVIPVKDGDLSKNIEILKDKPLE